MKKKDECLTSYDPMVQLIKQRIYKLIENEVTEANLCSVGCRGMVEGYKHISEPIPRSKQNIILTSRSRKKRSQGIKLLKLRNKNFFNLFSVPQSNIKVDYIISNSTNIYFFTILKINNFWHKCLLKNCFF